MGYVMLPSGRSETMFFQYKPMDGDQARDIAVLRPCDPAAEAVPCMTLGWLGPRAREERTKIWAWRSVIAAGFPLDGPGSREEVVPGLIHWAAIGLYREIDGSGRFRRKSTA